MFSSILSEDNIYGKIKLVRVAVVGDSGDDVN